MSFSQPFFILLSGMCVFFQIKETHTDPAGNPRSRKTAEDTGLLTQPMANL